MTGWPPPPWVDGTADLDATARRRRERVLDEALTGGGPDPAAEQLAADLAAARGRADALQTSAAYEVGSLVLRSRRPRQAVKLPAELARLRRRRQQRATARGARSGVVAPPATADPEALYQSFDAPVPLAPDLPRLAVVAGPSVVRRLGAAAQARLLRPMAAARGLAAGDDALLVALSAGARGPWFGLGSGDVPERDAALRALLDRAGELEVPVVLLVDRDPGSLPAASGLAARAAAVLGDRGAPWDPGVDWRHESPLGPARPVGDVWLGTPAADAPADALAVGDPAGALDAEDAALLGALLRGAGRVLVAPDAPAPLRRLAGLTGRALDPAGSDAGTWAPGPAEAAAGRALLRATAGRDDVAARVAEVVAALGATPAPTRPTVTVVAGPADPVEALVAHPQVVGVVAPEALRAARGDALVRAGRWSADAEVVGDVLAAACYADAVELTTGPVAGAVGRAWATSSAVLVRRDLADPADPWSVDGVRVALLPQGGSA